MSLLKRKKKGPLQVAIFGSGPAGLFAAQAVQDMGHYVRIFAKGERSPLYGAQYLHAPIPGCSRPEGRQTVSYILKGTVEGYRRKVYGEGYDNLKVSPETLAPSHDAWDIRAAYDAAWERFSPYIEPKLITPNWLESQGRLLGADLVVWSIPLMTACVSTHGFLAQPIWAQGDAPELQQYATVSVEPWTIVTNGDDTPAWYRASNVFGHRTVEWAARTKPPIEGIARVNKPIDTNCTCWSELGGAPVLRVGRYGTWRKGELSHQAYYRTRQVLERMG